MKAEDFAKKLNEHAYLQDILVPILDGFQIIPNPGTIFTAVSKEHYIQQFLVDGKLNEGESFQNRLNHVLDETKKAMKESKLENPDDNLKFFKEYSNVDFQFSVYLQDNILSKKWIRQFNIYFVDSRTKAFYEISFSSRPFTVPNNSLKKEIDLDHDLVTAGMVSSIQQIMANVKYKEKK